MTKNFFAVLLTSLVFLSSTGFAMAAMLDFDDITPIIDNGSYVSVEVQNGYGGLNWFYSQGLSNSVMAYNGHGAFDDGVVSPEFAAVIGVGTAEIWDPDSTFDFIGAYFTGGWYTVGATVEGYLGDNLVYSQTVTAYNSSPTWYAFNYMGIDKLVFPGHGSNQDYVIDNFTYNHSEVPEPASLLLLGSGLVGMIGLRKVRK